MGWLDDAVAEITNLQNIARRKKVAEQWARTISADTAKRIGEIGRWYSWLPAGVITSLGQAGYDPLSEDTRRVVAEATRAQASDPLSYIPPGTPVRAGSFTRQQREQASRDVKFAASYLRDPYAELRHRLSKHGPEWVERLDRKILERNLSRDDLAELAKMKDNFLFLALNDDGGWGPKWLRDNPLTDNVLEPLARHTFTGENAFARGVRGTARYGTAVMQMPQQYAQAQYRTTMENIRQHGVIGGTLRSAEINPMQRMKTVLQTDAGQIAFSLGTGEAVDTGSGFFVGAESQVAQRRRAAEVEFGGTYENGQVRTLGRDLADVFFEPGTREFNIMSGVGDAAVALGADYYTFGASSAARRSAQQFRSVQRPASEATTALGRARETAMGLIPGVRATYDPQLVDSWLGSRVGRRTIERIAEETSISRLDQAFNRKVPVEILRELVDETDPDEITRILKGHLGLTVREAPSMGLIDELGFKIKDALPPRMRRLASALPTREHVDLGDARESLTQLERALVNVNADRATIDDFMRRMADARSVTSRRQVWFDMWSDVTDRLMIEQGYSKTRARELTRLFENNQSDIRKYFVDAEGIDRPVLGAMVDGQLQQTPSPHLSVELLDRWMPMPDPRALRRAFSDPVTRFLLENPRKDGLRGVPSLLLAAQEKIWKPLTLLRGAYTLRVMGEEQLRIAAAGFKAMPNHPASYMAFLVGDSPRVQRMLEKFGKALPDAATGRAETDIFGGLLRESDEFGAAMFRGGAVFDDEIRLSNYIVYRRGEPGYLDAVADELATLAADPGAQMVARVAGGTPARQQFIDVADELAETRGLPRVIDAREVGDNLPAVVDDLPAQRVAGEVATETAEATRPRNPLREAQDRFWNEFRFLREEMADSRPNAALDLRKRADSDEYVVTMLQRVNIKTGMRDDGTPAHPKLLEIVRTGRVDGEPLFRPGTPFVNPKAVEKLAKYEEFFPEYVRGPQTIRLRTGRAREESFRTLSNAVDWGFARLATKPANYLSRSPVFRQSYVDEVIALAPKLDRQHLDELMRWADANKLSKADKATLRNVIGTATGDTPLTMGAVDQLAKGYALDNVKSLLYDLAERSQFFDVFRLIFPFGEAWKEMVGTWGRLLQQNPKLPLTVKRVLEAGRNPTVGELVGAPEGQGAFYENAWGEEVFMYPATGQLLGLLGQPETPLTGRLSGLSLMTEVLPGVGPVVQIPAAALLPDRPSWDPVSQFLFPFGRPSKPGDPHSWLAEIIPPWMRTLFRGATEGGITAEGQRQFAYTVHDVIRWMVATSEYDVTDNPDSAAELTRLVEDAKQTASWMLMIRGAAQWGAPSSPVYEWYIEVPDGRKLPMLQLVEEYRRMQEEDFSTATVRFLEEYGDNAFLLMQGKSVTVSPGILAPTTEANNWLRENGWAQKAFPLTYGFFAPQGGEFSAEAYRRQLELDEREPLQPEQFVRAGNDMIGKAIYYAAREKALAAAQAEGRKTLSDEQSAVLRELDEYLRQHYEGYGDEAGKIGRAKPQELIDELTRAVADHRLRDLPISKSISEYLRLRDAVRAKSEQVLRSKNSYQSATSEPARALRAVLVEGANMLIEENPDFAVVWERVFRDEIDAGLRSDDQEVTRG